VAPTQVVIDSGRAGGAASPDVQAAVSRLRASVTADREVAGVRAGVALDPTRRYVLFTSYGKHDYGEPQEQSFAKRLRSTLIPNSRFPSGTRVLAGGAPPQGVDFLHQAFTLFPWLILAVLVLTYLLLMRAFRSLLLPLKAVLLNVLSISAAWGVVTLVWQKGYGSHLLWGIGAAGAIPSWLPLMVFAFLYGLSMDYEVFILSRMREEYDATGSTSAAVVNGIGRTGRLVTSAALILFLAFLAMSSAPSTQAKMIATGLGAGILFDATVIRALLVPAAVSLFGRWNWWLPKAPARLLRVQASPGRLLAEDD
jgi:uncharacterized membrane protein YdfJ with MMPL/SSD domain